MSRTCRRRRERYEYRWVLSDFVFESDCLTRIPIDRDSPEGRRAIARFHSDAQATMKGGVPRWFRRIFKRSQRNANTRELLHWFADSGHDPVMNARHRGSAKWAWW
jgi:hypothetical protein